MTTSQKSVRTKNGRNQLKRLAGIPVTESKAVPAKAYKQASTEVLNSASKTDTLKWLGENYKDYTSAMSAVNDFMMVAGRSLPIARRAMLETMKNDIRILFKEDVALEPFNMSLLRKMAGMNPLITPVVEMDDAEADAPPAEGDVPAEEEAPAIIAKIATKAEGKTGEEMIGLITQVYDAGVADGKLAAAAEVTEANLNPMNKSPKALGSADAYYHRGATPAAYGYKVGSPEYKEYMDAYNETEEAEGPRGGKRWDESVHDDSNKVTVTEAKKPTPGQTLTSSVGVDKEDDAGWMAVELAKAGLVVDMEEAMGVFYFNFKNKSDEAKAKKLADKLKIALV